MEEDKDKDTEKDPETERIRSGYGADTGRTWTGLGSDTNSMMDRGRDTD